MDADIEAARRDIEREWNENTKGIIWPPELRDDAADRAIERRWNERHKARHLVWRTELSDDIPGWVILRPVPPKDWDRDRDEYWVLGPMCLVRIHDRAEVNLDWDADPSWPAVCAVLREAGETATADEIHTELHHRWKEEEERYQAEARAQHRERWKFWKRSVGGPSTSGWEPVSETIDMTVQVGGECQIWTVELHTIEAHSHYRLSLRSPDGVTWSTEGGDVFSCLIEFRKQVEPEGVLLCCNGARRDAGMSAMMADMGEGRSVYLLDGVSGSDGRKRTCCSSRAKFIIRTRRIRLRSLPRLLRWASVRVPRAESKGGV